jgi:hypothetical protein
MAGLAYAGGQSKKAKRSDHLAQVAAQPIVRRQAAMRAHHKF